MINKKIKVIFSNPGFYDQASGVIKKLKTKDLTKVTSVQINLEDIEIVEKENGEIMSERDFTNYRGIDLVYRKEGQTEWVRPVKGNKG